MRTTGDNVAGSLAGRVQRVEVCPHPQALGRWGLWFPSQHRAGLGRRISSHMVWPGHVASGAWRGQNSVGPFVFP